MYSSSLTIELIYHYHQSIESNRSRMIKKIEHFFSMFETGIEELEININFEPGQTDSEYEEEDNDGKLTDSEQTNCPAEFRIFDILDSKITSIAPTIRYLKLSIYSPEQNDYQVVANNLNLFQNFPQALSALEKLDISLNGNEDDVEILESCICYEALIRFLNRFHHRHQIKSLTLDLKRIATNEDSHVGLTSEFLSACSQLTEIKLLNFNYTAMPDIANMLTQFLMHHRHLEDIDVTAEASFLELIHLNQILVNPNLKKISWSTSDISSDTIDEQNEHNSFLLKVWADFANKLSKATKLQELSLKLESNMEPYIVKSPAFFDQFYYYFTKGLVLNRSLFRADIAYYSFKLEHLHLLCPFLLQVGSNPNLVHLDLPIGIPKSIYGLSTKLSDLKLAYASAQASTLRLLAKESVSEVADKMHRLKL
jgi:hypothetical protein